MTVKELIQLLLKHDLETTVVLSYPTDEYGGERMVEVQDVELYKGQVILA